MAACFFCHFFMPAALWQIDVLPLHQMESAFSDRDDNRRGMLQEEALTFLMKQRDIRNYKDVFTG